MAEVGGERYLVSMLGEDVNWVRNARAAGGRVVIRHGRREKVRLEEVVPDLRAPVLKAYLKRAPNARAHLPVDKDAPLAEFGRVSPRFPVFRIVPREQDISDTWRRSPGAGAMSLCAGLAARMHSSRAG